MLRPWEKWNQLYASIYKRHNVGCCLYSVLENENLKDSDVLFCLKKAKESGHEDCLELAEEILKMSKTQRKKFVRRGYYGKK